MKVFSCFSGIEAASVAFKPLGFQMVGFSEVDKFCSELLKQKFPNIKNYGDITKHREWKLPRSIDFLCGGPPCQSFSLAGLRKGMEDARGNLSLEYLSFLKQTQPRWILMENVFGILSSNKGRDFGTILASLAKLGYGFAYCVLDAQNFGVPQRRRRVFVVGHINGDWRRPAQVLFNAKSLFGHIEEDEKKKIQHKSKTKNCPRNGIAGTICADSHPRSYSGQDAYTNRLIPEEIVSFQSNTSEKFLNFSFNKTGTLTTHASAFSVFKKNAVRRLTPLECERLQRFPDHWTRIAYKNKPPEDCPDGPRYKAIGNSWAVPVVRWIGERIKEFDG